MLRKCRICGFEAIIKQDLKRFHKNKTSLYGRENLCKNCQNASLRRDGKYGDTMKRLDAKRNPKNRLIYNPRRIRFKDKRFLLPSNPRTNICSDCGKEYPKELKRQTHIHHDSYDPLDLLTNTRELCTACHKKYHRERGEPWQSKSTGTEHTPQ